MKKQIRRSLMALTGASIVALAMNAQAQSSTSSISADDLLDAMPVALPSDWVAQVHDELLAEDPD